MSATEQIAVPKKPERPIWPTYSWRAKNANAQLLYIRDHRQVDLAIVRLCSGPALGFDLEWRPNFIKGQLENPVALVQLSNEDTILLIQISAMEEFPSKLRELLEDPNIVKAGVGIQHDCKKLYADWNISVRNCVDLSLFARCVDNARWKGRYVEPIGLSRLVETYEELSLPKGKIQRSNWEARLSEIQQDYAANDAHSGFIIYNRFKAMAPTMASVPKPIYYSFDAINGRFLDSSGIAWYPSNPEYDPGPPPPPKSPKPPRTPKSTAAGAAVKPPAPVSTHVNRPPRTRISLDKTGSSNYRSSSSRRSYPPVDDSLVPLPNSTEQSSRIRRSRGRQPRRREGSRGYGQGTGA